MGLPHKTLVKVHKNNSSIRLAIDKHTAFITDMINTDKDELWEIVIVRKIKKQEFLTETLKQEEPVI